MTRIEAVADASAFIWTAQWYGGSVVRYDPLTGPFGGPLYRIRTDIPGLPDSMADINVSR